MFDRHDTVRKMQAAIPDLTQHSSLFTGGASRGVDVWLKKARTAEGQTDEHHIQAIFLEYPAAKENLAPVSAVLYTFWSLLDATSRPDLDCILRTAKNHFESTNSSSYEFDDDIYRYTISQFGSNRAIRVDAK